MLSVTNHDRDSAGLSYVYPVLSRRANGLSIGINLNPNNACNWQCIYCQVPNLTRGNAPTIDLNLLRLELDDFLDYVLNGSFFEDNNVETAMREIKDIALSGNGEPTSSKEFVGVVAIIKTLRNKFSISNDVKTVLITNGSLMEKPYVIQGLKELNTINGEVWFKIDSATKEGMQIINQSTYSVENILQRLASSSSYCQTVIQSCFFKYNDQTPSDSEIDAYLELIKRIKEQGISIKEVLLYGLARPSMQPEAKQLASLEEAWFHQLASKIEQVGLTARVNV